MSKKKSRRARRRRATRAAPGPEAVSAPAEGEGYGGGPPEQLIDFAEQYSYVYGDLKRIAILAGALFAILIALSFVIR